MTGSIVIEYVPLVHQVRIIEVMPSKKKNKIKIIEVIRYSLHLPFLYYFYLS